MTRLKVDELDFELRASDRRKTVAITVDRGGELVLAAPAGVAKDALRTIVRKERFWIYKKLAEKGQLRRDVPKKEYIDGEGFLYLGRSYRLKLVDTQDEVLKLIAGRFCLRRAQASEGRAQFIRWYTDRGRDWLSAEVAKHAARMEVSPTDVKVQDLGYRWGSCGKGGSVHFHWKTILLPRAIAQYVVIHELAHLLEPHHTPAFWRRVERAIPDLERRKAWLAAHGMDVEGL